MNWGESSAAFFPNSSFITNLLLRNLRPVRYPDVSTLRKHSSAALAIALLTLLNFFPTPALALKVLSRVTPESAEANGFSLTVEKHPDGTVRFTLSRDLTKVRQFPADSGLKVSRSATLRVYDPSGLRAVVEVAPTTRAQPNTTSYRFTLAPDCVATSTLTVTEDDDYVDPKEERLLGGGTHYEFALGPFAGHSSVEQAPK